VNAAMLTAAVRIDTRREADVRAVVVRNDGARRVLQELRRRRDRLGFCFVPLPLVMKTLEAIGRIRSCAAAANGTVTTIHADVRSDWAFSAGIGRTANSGKCQCVMVLPKKGVWNFRSLKTPAFIETGEFQTPFLGKAMRDQGVFSPFCFRNRASAASASSGVMMPSPLVSIRLKSSRVPRNSRSVTTPSP